MYVRLIFLALVASVYQAKNLPESWKPSTLQTRVRRSIFDSLICPPFLFRLPGFDICIETEDNYDDSFSSGKDKSSESNGTEIENSSLSDGYDEDDDENGTTTEYTTIDITTIDSEIYFDSTAEQDLNDSKVIANNVSRILDYTTDASVDATTIIDEGSTDSKAQEASWIGTDIQKESKNQGHIGKLVKIDLKNILSKSADEKFTQIEININASTIDKTGFRYNHNGVAMT